MILNDVGVQDEDSVDSSAFSISTCVDRLAHALEGFISVGQGQIQSSQDPVCKFLISFDSVNTKCEK